MSGSPMAGRFILKRLVLRRGEHLDDATKSTAINELFTRQLVLFLLYYRVVDGMYAGGYGDEQSKSI